MKRLNAEPPKKPPNRQEKDIVQILAKIKGKVVRERIRVLEFMRDFDRFVINKLLGINATQFDNYYIFRCNEQVITRTNFHRALLICGFELTCNEIETLMEVYVLP